MGFGKPIGDRFDNPSDCPWPDSARNPARSRAPEKIPRCILSLGMSVFADVPKQVLMPVLHRPSSPVERSALHVLVCASTLALSLTACAATPDP
eukprot:gene15920-19184_t